MTKLVIILAIVGFLYCYLFIHRKKLLFRKMNLIAGEEFVL